jgi:hypothetical protein
MPAAHQVWVVSHKQPADSTIAPASTRFFYKIPLIHMFSKDTALTRVSSEMLLSRNTIENKYCRHDLPTHFPPFQLQTRSHFGLFDSDGGTAWQQQSNVWEHVECQRLRSHFAFLDLRGSVTQKQCEGHSKGSVARWACFRVKRGVRGDWSMMDGVKVWQRRLKENSRNLNTSTHPSEYGRYRQYIPPCSSTSYTDGMDGHGVVCTFKRSFRFSWCGNCWALLPPLFPTDLCSCLGERWPGIYLILRFVPKSQNSWVVIHEWLAFSSTAISNLVADPIATLREAFSWLGR